MLESVLALFAAIRVFFRSRSDTALEVLALRQQVAVLKRKRPRPHLNSLDRLFWTILLQLWSRWAEVLVIVKPKTVVGWHRAGFRWYWRWRCLPRGGRPKISEEIRRLIRQMAQENAGWGAPKIHGELQKLGFELAERTVARYLRRIRRRGNSGQRWLTFLKNHREVIVAFDFFTGALAKWACGTLGRKLPPRDSRSCHRAERTASPAAGSRLRQLLSRRPDSRFPR